MTMDDDRVRFLCLFDELETSRGLLKSGFGHLQEMDMGSTFYHLPHQLLASGLERLMKCYIAAVRKGRDGAYPDRAAMKLLGHDLESLVDTIRTEHYGGTQRPLVQRGSRVHHHGSRAGGLREDPVSCSVGWAATTTSTW